MRKVTYTIDDKKYLEAALYRQKSDITVDEVNSILAHLHDFKAIYTLYGDGKFPDRYMLIDFDGKEISINSLNGYQRGCVLNDCMRHFSGENHFIVIDESPMPCGVISIEEDE